MNKVIDFALNHTRTVLTTLFLLLLAGIYAFIMAPKEAEPDLDVPFIYVSTSLDGISPEDAERLLLRPLEEELRSIEGMDEMTSTAFEGGANLVLEFDAGFDSSKAVQDVRLAVDRAKVDLPSEADEPSVHEVSTSSFPVVLVALSGAVPERTLLRLARDLRDRVEEVDGVLDVDLRGYRDEMAEVIIDPLRVESYGLDPNEVIQSFQRGNRLVAAGNLDTGQGRFPIKVPGTFADVEDIYSMPVAVNGDAAITLRDIAEIRRTFEDPTSFARVNGEPAITLEVNKRADANVIAVVDHVRDLIAEEQQYWPETVQANLMQDMSKEIRIMLSDLSNAVLIAVILVMIICVAALGARAAGIVGVAIPGSFVVGMMVIYWMGMSINVMVLFSLILAVGMLVDGAIVITEYADRKMSEGNHRKIAYGMAAKRMALPIIASTATTLAAFLPLLIWPGFLGEYMSYMPITLIAVLTASLAMALIFIPTIGSLVGRPGAADPRTMQALSATNTDDLLRLPGITGRYVRLLNYAIARPGRVLMATIALMVGIYAAYGAFGKGVQFFPPVEPEMANVNILARGNLSIEESHAIVRNIESRILDVGGIESFYARTGGGNPGDGSDFMDPDMPPDTIGTIVLNFKEWYNRGPVKEILDEVRDLTADSPGIRIEVREGQVGPPVGKPIQIEVTSNRHPDLLPEAIEHLHRGFAEVGQLIEIEDNIPLPGIEWTLSIDRAEAAKYGLDMSTIGEAVQLVTRGITLGTYRPVDARDEVDIVVRYPATYRTLEQLDEIRVSTPQGTVPISNFVQREAAHQVGTIDRINSQRMMVIKADVEPGLLPDTKVQEIEAWLEENPLDSRLNWRFTGEDEEQEEAEEFLATAFTAALFIMLIILLTQFNSFYSASLILSAVIMSTIGVFIGLLIAGRPFDVVFTTVGIIALAGIIVNNNIVLIDTFDRLKKESATIRDAILRTGAQRLRPVFLTMATTALGLMPMALGMNVNLIGREIEFDSPSTQWWQDLALAIVAGLIFATLLTLVVTPSLLMLRENARQFRVRFTARWSGRRQTPDNASANGRPAPSAPGSRT